MSSIALGGGQLASAFLIWLSRACNDKLSAERRQAYEWLAEQDPDLTPDTLDLEEISVEQVAHLESKFSEQFAVH